MSLITTVMFSQKNAKIEYYEFEREGKYGKVDGLGKILIPAKYDSFGQGDQGLLPAELNDKYGVVD